MPAENETSGPQASPTTTPMAARATRPAAKTPKPKRVSYDATTIGDVALEVFRVRGYDATSMEDLARAAGVTKPAFYHHVGGKEELLARGLTKALDALFAMLEEPEALTGTASRRLRHIIRRIVELEDALLAPVTVLLRSRGTTETERQALLRRRTFDTHVAGLIAEGQREGSLRADLDPNLMARLVIGMATWVIEWYQPGGRLTIDEVANAVVEMASTGMLRPFAHPE
jgi:AcrR family transcriptional regulator